jgi:uncharacterized protein YbjT (DUF2867 family)
VAGDPAGSYFPAMRVLLLGASGMIGQGVLLECLKRAEVTKVLAVGRTSVSQQDPKLEQLIKKDLYDWADVADRLRDIDAVLFCLGVSSGGMSEAEYTKVTYELTMSLAKALPRSVTFCFISGAGADGSAMWARVKRRTEQELLAQGFKAAYCFRPAFIEPMDGIQSKTGSYRVMYKVLWPFFPLFRLFKGTATSTRQLGHAMVEAALKGAPTPVLESTDINAIA